ncbi:cytochrome c oxidase assembly protein [Pseudogracilibacillus auburnensis]|uniref:cytochrome c oxidase assembly protein n=1 Tax=Pseudogracilibacillus auburnensis TaxID=1494959 RepID=UPI001A96C334|nr:cytochrome c oxidase assembly protein [Pseudogracilibacillus auburnensis]MBO1005687.1 cytochrome c oxidase assembly protein [Pseudogracilibacillus auburnensis]
MINTLLVGQLTWNTPLLLLLIAIITLYFGFFIQNKQVTTSLEALFFLTGIVILYLATGSPLLTISYLSFSLHMIQMSLLFFIIPPLILLGIPYHLYNHFNKSKLIQAIGKMTIPPRLALTLFAIFLLLYHLPFVQAYISQQPILQKCYLTLLFFLSFRMLWPIASPNPALRFSKIEMNKYVLQSGLFIMPACLFFIIGALFEGMSNPFLHQLATHLCMPADANAIYLLPPPFNTKYDQAMAGLLMMALHKFGLMFTHRLESKC